MKALIIDDDVMSREAIELIMEELKVEFVSVAGVIEALEVMSKDEDITIVFSDYHMEPFCGKSFVAAIRQEERFNDIPLIMLTCEDSSSAVRSLIDIGIDGYLLKPITIKKLVDVLNDFGLKPILDEGN